MSWVSEERDLGQGHCLELAKWETGYQDPSEYLEEEDEDNMSSVYDKDPSQSIPDLVNGTIHQKRAELKRHLLDYEGWNEAEADRQVDEQFPLEPDPPPPAPQPQYLLDKFMRSDIEDAARTERWLRLCRENPDREPGEGMENELEWIVEDKQIPTAWFAAEILAPQNGIRCIEKHTAPGMDGRHHAIVKAEKGSGPLRRTHQGASAWEKSNIAICFAFRNCVRQLLPQQLNGEKVAFTGTKVDVLATELQGQGMTRTESRQQAAQFYNGDFSVTMQPRASVHGIVMREHLEHFLKESDFIQDCWVRRDSTSIRFEGEVENREFVHSVYVTLWLDDPQRPVDVGRIFHFRTATKTVESDPYPSEHDPNGDAVFERANDYDSDRIFCDECQRITDHFDHEYKGPMKVCVPCWIKMGYPVIE